MAGRKKQKYLTMIELQLMLICWEMGEVPASYIWKEFNQIEKRSYSAIKTELDRITEKGYLQKRKLGPIWLYQPRVTKAEVFPSLVDRVMEFMLRYDFFPMFVRFVDRKKLSPKAMEELKKLIDEANNEK